METKTFSTPLQLFHVLDLWELEGERLLIQDHFGAYSNSLGVFDINGERLWSYPSPSPEADEGANAGVLGFSEEHGLLAILEPSNDLDIPTPVATLYRFDAETFELTPLWTKPTTLGLNISPTGEFIALYGPGDNTEREFNADLWFVDQAGEIHYRQENSFLLNWRPEGGAIVREIVGEAQTEITYVEPDSATNTVLIPAEENVNFVSGAWSLDGQYFSYSVTGPGEKENGVYLWRFDDKESDLIQKVTSNSNFRNFIWRPDSQSFYFTLGRETLQFYDVETGKSTLIAVAVMD